MKTFSKSKLLILTLLTALFAFTLILAACGGNNEVDNRPRYTVTFDSNGGSAVADQIVPEGDTATYPTSSLNGFVLSGWYKTNNTEPANRYYFANNPVTEDITLYAGWIDESTLPEPTASLTYTREGEGYIVSGVGSDTSIVIPATYEGLPVFAIGEAAFTQKSIVSVTIPDSILEIRLNAFFNCTDLATVAIGETSRLTSIGNNAFSGNRSLTGIYIPSNLTTLGTPIPGDTTIGNAVFNNCGSIESFFVAGDNRNFYSANGHLIERARQVLLRGGSANGTIPSGVRIIGQAAFRRSNLESISIPASVTQIENYVFDDMDSLTEIEVSGQNANYSSLDGVLYNKAQTEMLEVPEGISGDISLPRTLAEIPSFAFDGRSQLTSIYVPTSVENIRSFAFRNTTLTIKYAGTETAWQAVTKHSTWGGSSLTIEYEVTQEGGILVLYFSATSRTEGVAEAIAEQTGGDLIEVAPEVPYTTDDLDYNDPQSRVSQENFESTRPAISDATYAAINIDDYAHVFIGFPIWWSKEPPIIRTLIEHYSGFAGKNVYAFSTSYSSGGNGAYARVTTLCQGATMSGNLHLSDNLSSASTRVATWLESLDLVAESEENDMRIKMAFASNEIYVDLIDNSATRDLASRLATSPMTLEFSDYASAEKIAYPTPALDVSNVAASCDPVVGDLTIYKPWGNLAAFYRDTSGSSASLVLLGKIADNGIELLASQSGDFSVTISLA